MPPGGRDTLEHKDDGRGCRGVEEHCAAGMGGVGPQTAPGRHVQGVQRPEVRGEARRCRGSVSEPAGERDRAVRRREVLGAGARPHAGVAADDEGPRGDDDPRLQAQRHHHPVRGVERVDRHGDRAMPAPPPPRGVPEVPAHHRPRGSHGPAGPPDPGQLRHPQARRRTTLAGQAPPLPPAFHANLLVVAQPGRTLVPRADRQSAAARRLRVGARPDRRDRGVHRRPQQRPETLRVDRHRRIDPGQGRAQVGREATEPMREDIRLLGAILGDTVREQNGEEVFDLVERARVESFRVRRSEIDRAELAGMFDGIDIHHGHPRHPRLHALRAAGQCRRGHSP